jgi:hypothetical protein
MPNGPHNRAKLEHLAMFLAAGGSVAAFAREHEIPRRTCYLWTKSEGFQTKVRDYRSKIIDKLVGSLARLGKSAVRELGVLAKGAESEAVRLQACRAILSDMINVGTYASVSRQFDEMAARIDILERATNGQDQKTT